MSEETKTPEQQETPKTEENLIPQAQVNRIVEERLARERAKYADYPDLAKKVQEFEKQQEQLSQQELEKKAEYDKLKDGWGQKEQQYQGQLNDLRNNLQQEKISNALNTEVLKNNAYPDAVDLLKSMAKVNEDGTITVKGKDANGIDTDLPLSQGVEAFLKNKPYLVRGSGTSGAGTSSGTTPNEGGQGNDDNLAQQLQNAMAVGDRKLIQEVRQKIKLKHASQGINSKIL